MSSRPPIPDLTPLAVDEIVALQTIVAGVAHAIGDDFLRTLVEHLAKAVGVRHAFVSEFTPPQQIRTLAFWSNGGIVENIEYELPGTPCEEVINGGLCHFPSGVHLKYPKEAGIESYLGVPLKAEDGKVLGHLCVLDEAPLPAEPRKLSIFKIFAGRAAAELDRLRLLEKMRSSEARFKDLFDEAPIAYVREDLHSRFLEANHAAMRILGITADEIAGTYGKSFIPDTPDAQRRFDDAFAAIGKGADTSGIVLELRRKDNGKPVWIQWWSKPDPSGTHTRTMFLDITERVLMEQEQARLKAQNVYLQEEIKAVHNFDEIVGANHGLVKVLDDVRQVATTHASVLIWGSTGTGKELIARAIHSASNRADKPFIKINCASLPAGLIESELFGHERGAFSGAIQRRIGRFELAHTGTIFLDEIGEVPLDVQVKLLRVLQEHEIERVGGSQTIKTDVRVIAATNRDLPKAIRDGAFREDLYYRLNVFPINLPPLRERRDDIPLLVQYFTQKYAPKIGRRIEAIEPESMRRLTDYQWPGNVRELENIVERALILAKSPILRVESTTIGTAATAEPAPRSSTEPARATDGDLNAVQRDHIRHVLQQCQWVIEGEDGAASRLGLQPSTLRYRMKKLGISRKVDER